MYYQKNVHSEIHRTGRWTMKRHHGMNSITTNSIEGFNHLLKIVRGCAPLPVDSIVLAFFQLTQYYDTEITRAQYGQGQWSISPEVKKLYPDEDMPDLPETVNPEDIYTNIRDARQKIKDQVTK